MLIASAKSIYIKVNPPNQDTYLYRKIKHFISHIHGILTNFVMMGCSGNIFLFILFFFPITCCSYCDFIGAGHWILAVPPCTCLYCAILHGFHLTHLSELMQTSHLLLTGGLQPCENYFGFAGRRSQQSFPSNSLWLRWIKLWKASSLHRGEILTLFPSAKTALRIRST